MYSLPISSRTAAEDGKKWDDGLRSWAYENQRTDSEEDVIRDWRLMSGSECTTSDLMLFQYQLNYADSTHDKVAHYSISAD